MRALLVLFVAVVGCKPEATKIQVGPFQTDRYEVTAPSETKQAGNKQFCFVFGPDTNQPVRLCGDGSPTPDHNGVLFSAVPAFAHSEFVEKVGPALDAGFYLLKPIGTQRADVWPLGKPLLREWLAGKRLLTVDTTTDHITHVRVVDWAARADRQFDVRTTTTEFILVRAPNDVAVLLVQKNGGEELLLLENPVDNPLLTVANVADGRSAGNRKFYASGSIDRLHHGVFQPPTGFFGHVTWNGTKPLYDDAPLGPFEETKL